MKPSGGLKVEHSLIRSSEHIIHRATEANCKGAHGGESQEQSERMDANMCLRRNEDT